MHYTLYKDILWVVQGVLPDGPPISTLVYGWYTAGQDLYSRKCLRGPHRTLSNLYCQLYTLTNIYLFVAVVVS